MEFDAYVRTDSDWGRRRADHEQTYVGRRIAGSLTPRCWFCCGMKWIEKERVVAGAGGDSLSGALEHLESKGEGGRGHAHVRDVLGRRGVHPGAKY